VVLRGTSAAELTDAQFAELGAAGGISITDEARRNLNNIAASWKSHDLVLNSPRPHEFRRRLQAITACLKKAHDLSDLNGPNATPLERHLYLWLLNDSAGRTCLSQLESLRGALIEAINSIDAVVQSLPRGTGSKRASQDYCFIRYLADQFEACGGKATAYHDEEGYAKTPFRQFVHGFYEYLSLRLPRVSSGLDDAIRRALRGRRRKKKGKLVGLF
jgi:hypothetical protein